MWTLIEPAMALDLVLTHADALDLATLDANAYLGLSPGQYDLAQGAVVTCQWI